MTSSPIPIHYTTDLVHIPIRYDRAEVQQFYYDMSRKMFGGYQSLAFNYGNIEMFTVYGSGGSSRLYLLPDRFRVAEQNSGIKLEDFRARVEVTMRSAANVFGVTHFPFQTTKIRTVTQPLLWQNGIHFLADKICNFEEDDLESFSRPPDSFSMGFTFLGTTEEQNTFNVKVDAQRQAQNAVSIEIDGSFSTPISADGIEAASNNIQTTYDFINERVMSFLNRFDAPQT